jgi:MFS family permease
MNAHGSTTTAAGTTYDPGAAGPVVIVLAGTALMVMYVETMVLPAFKAFFLFFDDASTSTIVWIVSAYLLVGTVATPIFGKLGDKYGKKRMLLLVMALYTVAVGIAGFTPAIGSAFGVDRASQIYLLIGIRAFQGLGMAMFPLAFAMMPEVLPKAKVGQAQGIISGMFAAGAALGLVGGGYMTYLFGWQLTYDTVTPISLLLLILAYVYLRESPHLSSNPIDLPGIGSLGFALAMAMFGLTEGTYWGWTNFSGVTVAGVPWGVPQFFLLAIAATVFFLYWEPRAPTPVVSFKALKERNIWISNINSVSIGIGLFLVFVALVILIEDPFPPGFNYSPLQMGLAALPAAIGMLVFAPLWGRWVTVKGPKPVMLTGFAVMGLGALGLVFFHASVVELIVFAVPTVVGNIAAMIAMLNIIVLSAPPEQLGIQTGMNRTFLNLGSAVGPVLAAFFAATFTTEVLVAPPPVPPVSVPSITGFVLLFEITAAVALLGFLLSLGLRNYRFPADDRRPTA